MVTVAFGLLITAFIVRLIRLNLYVDWMDLGPKEKTNFPFPPALLLVVSIGKFGSLCPSDPVDTDGWSPHRGPGSNIHSFGVPLLVRPGWSQASESPNPGRLIVKIWESDRFWTRFLVYISVLFQHVERTFYESNGLVRRRESGYWLFGWDHHIKPELLAPLEPREGVKLVDESHCHTLPYCGLPYYFPYLKRIR